MVKTSTKGKAFDVLLGVVAVEGPGWLGILIGFDDAWKVLRMGTAGRVHHGDGDWYGADEVGNVEKDT